MINRLAPEQAPLKLTQENHPENLPETPPARPLRLASMVGIGALASLVGMAFGSAALSSCMMADGQVDLVSMIPLVALMVAILGGWLGAMFWMCREDASGHRR